jgi:hypothetical protein
MSEQNDRTETGIIRDARNQFAHTLATPGTSVAPARPAALPPPGRSGLCQYLCRRLAHSISITQIQDHTANIRFVLYIG